MNTWGAWSLSPEERKGTLKPLERAMRSAAMPTVMLPRHVSPACITRGKSDFGEESFLQAEARIGDMHAWRGHEKRRGGEVWYASPEWRWGGKKVLRVTWRATRKESSGELNQKWYVHAAIPLWRSEAACQQEAAVSSMGGR